MAMLGYWRVPNTDVLRLMPFLRYIFPGQLLQKTYLHTVKLDTTIQKSLKRKKSPVTRGSLLTLFLENTGDVHDLR